MCIKKILFFVLCFFNAVIIVLVLCGDSTAVEVFSEDFDNQSSSWNNTDGALSGWTSFDLSTPGINYGSEIEDSGCRSGKCFVSYRENGDTSGYHGIVNDPLGSQYQKLYFRMYMKIDTGFHFNSGQPHKWFGRFYFDTNNFTTGCGDDTLYFEWGSDSGNITLALHWDDQWNPPYFPDENPSISINDLRDGDWHRFEIMMDMNYGLKIWLDDDAENSPTYDSGDLNISPVAGAGFCKGIGLGIGNSTPSGSTYNAITGTSGVWFDDYVIDTEYIGPLDEADTTPPEVSDTTIDTDGETVTINLTETVSTNNYDTDDFSLDCVIEGDPINLAYSSGDDSSTVVFTAASIIGSTDSCTLDYTGDEGSGTPAQNGEIVDTSDNSLLQFSADAVTNNSLVGVEGSIPISNGTLLITDGTVNIY